MCEAAMPGDDQKLVFRKDVAQHVTVWKYRAKHQRPSSDSRAAHRAHGKHVVAGAECFANQCAGDAVCDGVHTGKGRLKTLTLQTAVENVWTIRYRLASSSWHTA